MIGAGGEQLGVVSTLEAMEKADAENLDLVEVSGNADPPVCRLMDYGKYKYQLSKRQHAAKKHQKVIHVKELKLRPKTEEHDLQFKVKNAQRFLEEGDKVKVSVVFMGREMAHKELGERLLDKFVKCVGEIGMLEQPAKNEGRNIALILAPLKK